MTTAEIFRTFVGNLRIENHTQIEGRYGEITAALNKNFRDTESKTANSLQVGSYGRWTAIKGISDLDMLYIVPTLKWDTYNKDGGQSKLLADTKKAIQARYPRTNIYVDRLVVCVLYTNFYIEVQPVFELEDGSFKYPDTKNGGSWKITKPREEIRATKEFIDNKNKNLRHLCKMLRAWKNKHGVGIGGLLIDTLAHNFLASTDAYDNRSYSYHDYMVRDFFHYASNLQDQDYYLALGSRQRVRVKQKFQRPAKIAHDLCCEAIDATGKDNEGKKWQKVFGSEFPSTRSSIAKATMESANGFAFRNTEQFIEDQHPVDIRYPLAIDCEVSQNGFRERLLSEILHLNYPLKSRKNLRFFIKINGVPGEYSIKWKVLNQGTEAQRRDCIRGQLVFDTGREEIKESTSFKGDHIVDCYIIKNNVVVAKDRIQVPISENL